MTDTVARRVPDEAVLDNPVWASLTGRLSHLAHRRGAAAAFLPGVSPFAALADPADPAGWRDLSTLVGPGVPLAVTGPVLDLPPGWQSLGGGEGVQLLGDGLVDAPDPQARALGADDVPDMLDLVARTEPGPFLPRTIELGSYLGIRRGGRLVAMAGERLQPPGWTEISAVCTDPQFQGQGLATRLIRAVAHGIRERGERPFLHTAATNSRAIRLYLSLGFTERRRTRFLFARTPC